MSPLSGVPMRMRFWAISVHMPRIGSRLSPKLNEKALISGVNNHQHLTCETLLTLVLTILAVMVTKRAVDEWLIEPDVEGVREYARLSIYAEPEGLNIDGQGLIPWSQLESSRLTYAVRMKKRHAAR